MTKLLYIPSGEYILFVPCVNYDRNKKSKNNINPYEYTPIWEHSRWKQIWPEASLKDVIARLCMPDAEFPTKTKSNIPINTQLAENEFEIIEDTDD